MFRVFHAGRQTDPEAAPLLATPVVGGARARSKKVVTRLLAWIGGALVALILTNVAVMQYIGPRLDAEAKAYVEQSLPTIMARWNVEDLRSEASPELLQALPDDKLLLFYKAGADRLGPLKAVQTVKGDSFIRFWAFPWSFTIGGNFVADVLFEKAAARVSIGTIRRGGQWRYTSLYVNSEAFLPTAGK